MVKLNACTTEKAQAEQHAWLHKLVTAVQAHFDSKDGTDTSITAESCGLSLKNAKGFPCTYTLPGRRLQRFTKEGRTTRIISAIHTILRLWLNYPAGISQIQGTFAHAILRTFGPDALLVNGIWDIYTKVKAKVLGRQSSVRIAELSPKLLDPFIDSLLCLPLASKTSAEAQCLSEIGECVKNML